MRNSVSNNLAFNYQCNYCIEYVLFCNYCVKTSLFFKGIECGYPANIKDGGYVLLNNTVTYLSEVLYSCDEGHEMTGNESVKPISHWAKIIK